MYYTGSNGFASLRQGLVGAWCASLPNGGSGNLLVDQSQRGNHGVLTNMSAGAWVSWQYGRALDFDGVNDFADYGTNVALGNATQVSFSAWVWKATQGAVYAFARYNSSLGVETRADLFGTNNYATNGRVNLSVTLPGDGTSYLDFYSTEQMIASQWNHIAGRCLIAGTSSQCSLFLNGKACTVNTGHSGTRPTSWGANNAVTYTSNKVVIGNGNSLHTSALVDDIRAYNRLLTDNEIYTLASRPGIGLRQELHRQTFYQFPSGARRKRILTGMP